MAAAQQGGQGGDNSNGILWGIAALFAVLGIVWYVFKGQIAIFYLSIKLAELNAVGFLYGIFHIDPTNVNQLKAIIQSVKAQPTYVTFENLSLIGGYVGKWIRVPCTLLMVILAGVVYTGSTTTIFRNTYKMRDFAKLEKNNWPQITPVIGIDLINTDIDTGPWSMAMSPMQFCKKYRLLQEMKMERRDGMTRQDLDKIEVTLKRGMANKLFALQVGQLWRGADQLPPYAKALFAVFAARINSDSAAAAKILLQLAASSTGSLNYNGVDALLKKHINTKLVKKIVEGHAYVLTVMASMLEQARLDGVQASADFLWLKPLDRRLWYMLNTVGRQTPFIEIAGAYAHWISEKHATRRLFVPMIDEATNACEAALKDIVYRRDEA